MTNHTNCNPPTLNAPLEGLCILELGGIGPSPFAGQILKDLGATIIRVTQKHAISLPVENRDKEIIILDLKNETDQEKLRNLIKTADVLTEGFRPGVCEKLGFGPAQCHVLNPKLIFARMTGWGQTGPWAHMAGHDINYIGLTGALYVMGNKNAPPRPPINFVGDYGGGSMFLVTGILSALFALQKTDKGCVVDVAIIDGTASLTGIVHSLAKIGQWSADRDANLLDGSRPFYRCYQTSDNLFMAVGCIEEKFYNIMLSLLNLNPETFGGQYDAALWEKQIQRLSDIFKAKTRAQWEMIFDGTDACVTPVLSHIEAPNHPQMQARNPKNTDFPPPAIKFS